MTDGPFSGLRPIIYNHTYTRHCLSRGFRDGKAVGRLPGNRYSPESIGSILRESTYKEFVRRVEIYLHNTMHQAIAGDFLAMTAANGKLAMVFPFRETGRLTSHARPRLLRSPCTARPAVVAMAARKPEAQT